jgi:hypothetical protein
MNPNLHIVDCTQPIYEVSRPTSRIRSSVWAVTPTRRCFPAKTGQYCSCKFASDLNRLGSSASLSLNFYFRFFRNRAYMAPSRLDERGERVVTSVGRDAVDAGAWRDERC